MDAHTGLNNLDFLVLGIILLSGLLALMRGFVREVLSLAVWVGSYFCAARFFSLAEPFIRQYIKSTSLATDIAAVAVFIVSFIILSFVSFLLAKFVKGDALTAIDRSLGFLFGMARGLLVVCLTYLMLVSIFWPDIDKPHEADAPIEAQAPYAAPEKDASKNTPPTWLMQAKTRPFIAYGAALLRNVVPEDAVEIKAKAYLEQKNSTQHMIEQKTLDMLSTPTPTGAPATNAPAYDDKNRSNLNNLIEQKASP